MSTMATKDTTKITLVFVLVVFFVVIVIAAQRP
jgi:hypothetical protein